VESELRALKAQVEPGSAPQELTSGESGSAPSESASGESGS
jgi:hypothetical protein